MMAHAINERMARQLDYLLEEVRVLREVYTEATGRKRVPFTDEQRKRLAIAGKALTPEERETCCQLARPKTILEWFRKLTAQPYDGSKQRRKPGRPRRADEIRQLVVRLANENITWGYTKIRDAMRGLKIEIGRTTVANILAKAGIEPAPERTRKRTWKHFMRSHWEMLCACDFFTVESLGVFGTVRYSVFFVIELHSRAVHLAGVRIDPDEKWMMQMARNLLDCEDGFLRNATHLVHDRDPLFTKAWRELLKSGGVKSVRIPASSPNCNPYAERFVRTVRDECLRHFVVFGERHLRHLLREFVAHYNTERYHQGLGGKLVRPSSVTVGNDNGSGGGIECRSRLGGLLNFYRREAA
jgi:putative transposase